jgi:hypothetical protein
MLFRGKGYAESTLVKSKVVVGHRGAEDNVEAEIWDLSWVETASNATGRLTYVEAKAEPAWSTVMESRTAVDTTV